MSELNLGVLLTLKDKSATRYRFQNYKVSTTVNYGGSSYTFAPFSFSGAVANIQGDNLDAGLVFASTKVTRTWADTAITDAWIGFVQVVLLKDDSSIQRVLYNYTGSISSGGWDQTRIELSLNSVMDAVRGTVPGRRLNAQLVGNIPITATINV